MRFAAVVLFAAAAACNSFTATDPAQLTFGGGDGLEADGTDVYAVDSFDGDADVVGAGDSSDGTGEDIAHAEEVGGNDVAGEEVSSDGEDVEVLTDADSTDSSDDADVGDDIPDVDIADADSDSSDSSDATDDVQTDGADSQEDVPDVEEPTDTPETGSDGNTSDDSTDAPDVNGVDSSDAILTDADGTDGSADTINPPEDTQEDVGTTDASDTGTDATDVVEDIVQEDVGTVDGDVVEPPDTLVEEDIPEVDKCLNVICDTSDPCAPESCDSATGKCVVSMPVIEDEVSCEDGDFCTVGDVCNAGVCQSGGVDPLVCQCTTMSDCAHLEDDTLCTKPVTCVDNVCVLGALVNCNDENPCSYDLCVAQTGLCSFPVVPLCCRQDPECEDDNVCTQDWCELKPGIDQNTCFHKHLEIACDDGDICTVGDHCSINTGACLAGNVADCDDGDPCTNFDICFGGACVGKAIDCSDDDPCTLGESCSGGQCIAATQPDCSDDDACTLDSCVNDVGCTYDLIEPFVVLETANQVLSTGGFQPWATASQPWFAGESCPITESCLKQIGLKLSNGSAKIEFDLDLVGTPGVLKEMLFTFKHHYDIMGTKYPSLEIRHGTELIGSHTFVGPSEEYAHQDGFAGSSDPNEKKNPPLQVGASGVITFTFSTNNASVSSSPIFRQDAHFLGEVIIRDACH